MDAKTVCENQLSTIRKSDLNFVLSETPYSVNIVLKKTFIQSQYVSKRASSNATSIHLSHLNRGIMDNSLNNMQEMGNNFCSMENPSTTIGNYLPQKTRSNRYRHITLRGGFKKQTNYIWPEQGGVRDGLEGPTWITGNVWFSYLLNGPKNRGGERGSVL